MFVRCSAPFTGLLFSVVFLLVDDHAAAQPVDESHATTEQSCSFGMGKGEASHSCAVPFPAGCRVAQAPGSTKPWTTISKGGRLLCRFDDKQTDWKTKITGTCGRCQSGHCSAQFSVRFDCSSPQ
jgi:hypothetical protein